MGECKECRENQSFLFEDLDFDTNFGSSFLNRIEESSKENIKKPRIEIKTIIKQQTKYKTIGKNQGANFKC